MESSFCIPNFVLALYPGVWALLEGEASGYHNMLCITFVKETRFLLISDEELEMVDVPGFRSDTQTVYCGSVMGAQMLQVW